MGIFDDLLGKSSADASNAAALDTFQKQQAAGRDLRAYGDQYADKFAGLGAKFQPYQQAGSSALQQLMAGLGLGGDQQAFTDAYRGLPGYQSGLQTGTDAAIAGANSAGMGNSGRALKALQRYGSDYEDQRVGSYLDRLTGLTGMGQQATGQEVATAGQGLQGQLQTRQSAYGGDMNAAGTIGQGMVAGEQAKQGALTNLMSTAAYLGGAALGGPFGAAAGKSMFGGGQSLTPWGGGGMYDQGPVKR
jgi:hypothetical protein